MSFICIPNLSSPLSFHKGIQVQIKVCIIKLDVRISQSSCHNAPLVNSSTMKSNCVFIQPAFLKQIFSKFTTVKHVSTLPKLSFLLIFEGYNYHTSSCKSEGFFFNLSASECEHLKLNHSDNTVSSIFSIALVSLLGSSIWFSLYLDIWHSIRLMLGFSFLPKDLKSCQTHLKKLFLKKETELELKFIRNMTIITYRKESYLFQKAIFK